MVKVLKRILFELITIRKELQTIRKGLESGEYNKVSIDVTDVGRFARKANHDMFLESPK